MNDFMKTTPHGPTVPVPPPRPRVKLVLKVAFNVVTIAVLIAASYAYFSGGWPWLAAATVFGLVVALRLLWIAWWVAIELIGKMAVDMIVRKEAKCSNDCCLPAGGSKNSSPSMTPT